ncbi:MAG TPA: hypothetical protein DEA08_37175 [Planctomycetes bacterium]|nr:hypothetical protein [Planctomycetota bacterium]
MSYATYKILHLLGLMLVFLSLGGLTVQALMTPAQPTGEGEEGAAPAKPPAKAALFALHGIGMLLLLVAGFGILAKLKLGFPAWVHPKLLIWLILGAVPVIAKKAPPARVPLLFVVTLLGLAAAYLGVMKPWAG